MSEPLYRKWWMWAIGAVVLVAFFTGNDAEQSAPQPIAVETVSEESPSPEAVINPWADWYTLNEANWTALTNVLIKAEKNGIDYTFNKAIEYGENITPLPDAYSQSLFDSWLDNMRAAQMAWNNGDIQSATTYMKDAARDMNALTQVILEDAGDAV